MSEKNNDVSDQTIAMLVLAGVCLGIATHLDKIQRYAEDHWFMLACIGGGIVYSIVWIVKWKFRMKHPEVYERELAVKQLQNRNRGKPDGF
jgi:phage shock protein PspC (stress-responsive transcriptional regulator)